MQIQVYRKKAEDYNQVLLISEQKDQKIRQLEDTINQLDQDLSGKRQLEEQLKFVREEQNKEKLRVSQYEIQLQNREHQVNDLTKELKLQKKKEEMNLEKIRQLEEDLEERGRDSLSSINDGRDNLQSSLIQDLENRVKSLTQENEILKISNSAQLNQKLFEIEQSLIEEQRQKQSLLSQLELQIQRCQKFEDENESLRLNMETQKFEAKSDMKSPKQNDQKSNDDKKKLEENLNQAQARIKELEQNSSQILILQQQREQTLVEIKALYTEKNQMIDQIMKLKDELNSTKSQVQELQMKERFFDKEKQLLESQLKNQPSLQNDQFKVEAQQLKLRMKQIDVAYREKESNLLVQLQEAKKDKDRELRVLEKFYDQEITKLKNTVQELNDEVLNEKHIRSELEIAQQKQDELTASLIHSLGQRFQDFQKEMQHQAKWNGNTSMNISGQGIINSASKENAGYAAGISNKSSSENVSNFMSRKRQNTYKNFQTNL